MRALPGAHTLLSVMARKGGLTALLIAGCVLTLGLAAPPGAVGASLSFTFDGSDQGWLNGQDELGPFGGGGQWTATGGNPGGHLTVTDRMAETGCPNDPCHLATFYCDLCLGLPSPGLAAKYEGSFALDFNSDVAPTFPVLLEILSAGGDLVGDVAVPGTGWRSLSIPLTESHWDFCTASCTAATATQMKSALADADNLEIVADTASGTLETYGVDNVLLTDGPATASPPQNPPQVTPAAVAPTGQRSAALKKCAKVKDRVKKRRCKRRTRTLPV
jgi:hypothetical protein